MTGPERPAPGWPVHLLLYGAGFLVIAPTMAGVQVLMQPRSWNWGEVLRLCIPVFGSVVGAVVAWRLKTPERRRAEWAETRAVWTGALPEGADPAEWKRPVRLQAREAVVVGIGLLAVGVAGGALTAVAAASSGHDRAALWALAVAQLVTAVALIWGCARMARNGRRLQRQLRSES